MYQVAPVTVGVLCFAAVAGAAEPIRATQFENMVHIAESSQYRAPDQWHAPTKAPGFWSKQSRSGYNGNFKSGKRRNNGHSSIRHLGR